MKIYLILFILLTLGNNIFGQWNIAQLPDSIVNNNANVLLDGITTISIYSKENIIETTTRTILVQQNDTKKSIEILIPFDKFSKVVGLDVEIFKLDGKKIKSIKKKEFQNVAAYDGFTIATDFRFLYYKVIESNLPFVLQYSYTIEHHQSFTLPRKLVFDHKHVNISQSNIKVINSSFGVKIA